MRGGEACRTATAVAAAAGTVMVHVHCGWWKNVVVGVVEDGRCVVSGRYDERRKALDG